MKVRGPDVCATTNTYKIIIKLKNSNNCFLLPLPIHLFSQSLVFQSPFLLSYILTVFTILPFAFPILIARVLFDRNLLYFFWSNSLSTKFSHISHQILVNSLKCLVPDCSWRVVAARIGFTIRRKRDERSIICRELRATWRRANRLKNTRLRRLENRRTGPVLMTLPNQWPSLLLNWRSHSWVI